MTGMTPPELTLRGKWLDWPPIMRRPTMRRALWMGMRRSLRSTKTMNATTANMNATSKITATMVNEPHWLVWTFSIQVHHAAGQAGDDAGKDQQAHAVADAALGNLLAQPHDEGRAGGQRQHRHQIEADAGIEHHVTAGEHERDANRLHRGQNHGHIAGPLRDLAPPQFAFLLDARQRLINHGEQLEDDRGRDVGHDAQGEDGHAAQVAAAKQVHQAQGRAALLVEEPLQHLGVNARRGNPRSQAIDSQNAQHEEHPLAQIGNPENIGELLKHFSHCYYPLQGVCRRLNLCH
jgi:hypothetical protein